MIVTRQVLVADSLSLCFPRSMLEVTVPEPPLPRILRVMHPNCNIYLRTPMVVFCPQCPAWKQGFLHAYRVTKEACLDLKHVYEAQDVEFYTEKGVKLGIAKSFVGDVYL